MNDEIVDTFDKQAEQMLLATGRKPNLLYLGDETAVALGIPRKDLDLYRDETGLVAINNKGE